MARPTLLLLQVLVAVFLVLLWHVFTTVPIGGIKLLPPFFFSTPSDVAARIGKWLVEGTIWHHLWVTLLEAMLAFLIGAAAGILIGFWFARQPLVAAVLDPYVKMTNALPRVVLAPIFALWLGLGIWSKVALGFTLVFPIVFFNVYQGVREVSPAVLANARMLGMDERALMRHVYWPSALSWMFSSLTLRWVLRSWERSWANISAPPPDWAMSSSRRKACSMWRECLPEWSCSPPS